VAESRALAEDALDLVRVDSAIFSWAHPMNAGSG